MSAPLSSQAFRDALAQFASGVTIVATGEGMHLAGLTATAFSSVSLEPPLVLVCVAHTASAYEAIVNAETVGISVLAAEQGAIAMQFAKHGVDKFDGIRLVADRAVPLIEGALVHLECRRHARHEMGDHTVFVAEVVAASLGAGGEPLVHHGRRLGGFVPAGGPR